MAARVLLVLLVAGYVHSNSIRPLTCNQIRAFVDCHNNRRLQLAKGQVAGQPPASEMKYMVWDDQLAAKAAGWVRSNSKGHNPSRSLGSRFKVGENIFWFSTTASNYVFNPDQACESWFDEYKNYQYAPLQWSDFNRGSDDQIGHYTQMAWSDTVYVGCAIAESLEGNWDKFKVVCNYGPAGNFIGETPYKAGKPSGSLLCTVGDKCNKPYGNTC